MTTITIETEADRPTCEQRLWLRGETRTCGQSRYVTRWFDYTGRPHVGCRIHLEELMHRWPDEARLSSHEQVPVAQ